MYCAHIHESITMNKVVRLGVAHCMHAEVWAGPAGEEAGRYL